MNTQPDIDWCRQKLAWATGSFKDMETVAKANDEAIKYQRALYPNVIRIEDVVRRERERRVA